MHRSLLSVHTKYWHLAYGAAFVCLLMGVLAVAVAHGPAIIKDASSRFGLDMLFRWPGGFAFYIGLLASFTLLERWFPAGPQKSASGWLLNFKVILLRVVLSPAVGALSGACLGYLSSSVGIGLIELKLDRNSSATAIVLAFLPSLLAFDFFYYWWHRFQHENRIFWQLHKLHHMDEQMSATTDNRAHWLDSFLTIPIVLLPQALLVKFDPITGGIIGGVVAFTLSAWQVFIHSNIKVGFGWASPLVVSPQLHRIHHSRLSGHHDKNFTVQFPVWDVLFGTYYHPKRNEFPPTGVHDEKDVKSFTEAVVLPFREWWKMFREWRRQTFSPNSHLGLPPTRGSGQDV